MTEVFRRDVAEAGYTLPQAASLSDSLRLPAAQARIVAAAGRAGLIWLSLAVVYGSQRPLTAEAHATVALAAAVWLLSLRATSTPECLLFGRLLSEGLGAGVGLAVVAALNPTAVGLGLGVIPLVGAALAMMATTVVWDTFVDWARVGRRRVLVLGSVSLGSALAEDLRKYPHARCDLIGTSDWRSAGEASDELEQLVEALRPDVLVLTDEATFGDAVDRILAARANVRVTSMIGFCEYALGRIPVEHVSPTWFMALVHPRQHLYTGFAKRTFDVVVAAVGLVLTAPLLAVLALLVKTKPGPILHRQVRVGENGRRFTLYKLRTMACDAECEGPTFACTDDPRTTGCGRALRALHLDELPQLWNVLKGEMSIVGPRPERPEFLAMIDSAVPFWSRRLLVKPGITGWAQLHSGYASSCDEMAEKLSYDLWYLRHRGLAVDLAVCILTCFSVLARPLRG